MRVKAGVLALVSLFVFEILFLLFSPNGFNFIKIIISSFLIVSFLLISKSFVHNKSTYSKSIPRYVWFLYLFLMLWNFISIFRTPRFDSEFLTWMGNQETSLALLVPFSITLLNDIKVFVQIRKFLLLFILIGVLFFFPVFIFDLRNLDSYKSPVSNLLYFLLSPSVFFVSFFPFLYKKEKMLILIAIIFLFVVSFYNDRRAMLLRLFMLSSITYFFFNFKFINKKTRKVIVSSLVLIPLVLFYLSVYKSESAFSKMLNIEEKSNFTTDTRTFLYIELFDDLQKNNKLIIGKGSYSHYYSNYFSYAMGDSSKRISIEVGILGILLKGGVVAVFLNLYIILIAIFMSFFRSSNDYIKSIGIFLVVHFILLFIQNWLSFSIYNVLTWAFMGLVFSTVNRSYKNDFYIKG